MTETVLDQRVRDHVAGILGPVGLRLADLLSMKKEATDSELAEELGEKPSHIRKILYDLYEARIAEYHKEKDKETGWLTFFWKIDSVRALQMMRSRVASEIAGLEMRLAAGTVVHICLVGSERYDAERAKEYEFRCPEHGEVLEARDERGEIEKRLAELSAARENLAAPIAA